LDHSREVAERADDARDVVSAHPALARRGADLGLSGYLLGLRLGDLWPDNAGVSPCLEACPVLADLGVILCDPYPGCFCPGVNRGVHESRRLLGELVERRVDAVWGEQLG
jgi:hypothetical protein